MRRLALLVVMVLATAACGSAQPSPTMTSSPTLGEACALTTEPGPADEPNRDGGELDMTDYGGGRWRMCLTEPINASVEHTAWCIWTQDRTAVSEINGLRVGINALEYDTYLSIARNEFQLQATGSTGGVYEPAHVVPVGEASEDGRSGDLTFDVALKVDPGAGAPPGAESRYAGSMSWQCADPPPPG